MSAATRTARDPSPGNLSLLDDVPYEPSVAAAVQRALEDLASSVSARDLAILGELRRYSRHGPEAEPVDPLFLVTAAKHQIPVAAALLEWSRERPGPALTSLTAVLANLALGPEGRDSRQRNRIRELGPIVRNAIEKPNANLRFLVGEARSVASLASVLDQEIERGSEIHLTFNGLWRNWLRHRVARWSMADPARMLLALGPPPALTIDLDSPQLPLWGEFGAADDEVQWSGNELSGPEFDGAGTRVTHLLASSHGLLRRSGDTPLALHPDQIVPDGLVKEVAGRALAAGKAAIMAGAPSRAEPHLALSLQIASGFRELDLAGLDWGTADEPTDAVLLIDKPVLSLRIRRPPNAVEPPPGLAPYLKPSADLLRWPLPTTLHEALKMLAGPAGPVPGAPVLPGLRRDEPYRLRNTVAELLPGAQFGASRFRLVLAAHLASRHGPEIAQLAMRDSFSTSLGPAYYAAVPETLLSGTISSLLGTWFDEPVACMDGGAGGIGSRLVLKDDFARAWPKLLRAEIYSAARRKERGTAGLVASRNHLAASLCAATGLRPGRSIGALHLDSVIPEFGLVILEDKLVDVLRRTRVAVTGWRWTAELREYLDRLVDLTQCPDEAVACWAHAVLMSEQPLFSLPTGISDGGPLSMDDLVRTMPSPLAAVANHYRHRLCQRLMEKGVDWELRHAQLGWVVTPSFALADLSPLSAQMLGVKLGGTIDEILMEDGWFADRQRIPKWSWRGVPDRPLKDWGTELRRYESEHASHVRGVREEFKDRRREVETQVLPRLAAAVAECLPTLRLDVATRSIFLAPGYFSGEPVGLTVEHYLLLRERIRRSDRVPGSALESLAAEYLIHEVISKAIKERIVAGPIPPRRHLGATAELSPFMPGLGLAVRHAEAIRERLDELIFAGGTRDIPAAAQLLVMAGTPYRDLETATAVVRSASMSMRSANRQEWLCVPAKRDRREVPLVFAGVAAAWLARRGAEAPKAKALTRDQLSAWFERRFTDVALSGGTGDRLEQVVATLQMAGRMELSGPERLVMEGQSTACVNTERSVAISDHWPLRTADLTGATPSPVTTIKEPAHSRQETVALHDRTKYSRLTAALNREVSRSAGGRKTDGKHGWRERLRTALRRLADDAETSANLKLLVAYATHRLKHGGERVANLSQGTLYKEITRFGGLLLEVVGQRAMPLLDDHEIQAAYLAVVLGKPEATRPDVLEELVKFHGYLASVHHAADVDFAPLRAICGQRVRSPSPGSFSDVEVGRVLHELLGDLDHEKSRIDSGPQDVRACGLRVLAFILLEASGARPSSIHGLVLGDFHLLERGSDFLHIHRTGEYGEAKTLTSVGFIRLQGSLWEAHRDWVLAWLDQERSLAGGAWWKYPAFAESAGMRRRFARSYITDRSSQLLKWVTNDPRARVYWLRKRRITARMGTALSECSTPRAVYRALREAGHAGIRTTLESYIHDASVPISTYLRVAGAPDRRAVIRTTGLPANTLDQAWHRGRRSGKLGRMGEVLERLGAIVSAAPEECITDAPRLYRQQALVPMHLDLYARTRQRFSDPIEAMAQSGISQLQAEVLDRAASELLLRIGAAPWRMEGARQSRAVMAPARRLSDTERVFELMEARASGWLNVLLDAWLEQGYIQRLYEEDVVLVLRTPEEVRAAEELILSTGLRLQLGLAIGQQVLAAEAASSDERSAHTSALRWVLAMHWLHRAILGNDGSM